MADIERTLISKALQTGDFGPITARTIRSEHFADPEVRDIFDYAQQFMRQYDGSPPSVQIVKDEFPGFKPVVNRDPIGHHVDKFVLKVKERMAIDFVRDFAETIDDPNELPKIEQRAFEMARSLAEVLPHPEAHHFAKEATRRKEKYDQRKRTGNIKGTLMGIPSIDEVLLGLKPGQLLTIAAYMGVGKSILMTYIAYMAYLQGKTSLFISLEMDYDEVMERLDVLASNVRSQALMALDLNIGEEERWYKMLETIERESHEKDIIIRSDIQDCTVDDVFAEASRVSPDLVFVDYLELMEIPRSQGGNSQGWEKVSSAGKGLKQNARILRIPHVTAAQVNREGGRDKVTLSNIGHQSIGKHSDIMLGLQQDEEQEEQQEMDIIALKVRRGPKPRATMRWMLDTMDIHEKGISERFPKKASLSPKEQKKETKMSIKTETVGKENPWSHKTTPMPTPGPTSRLRRKSRTSGGQKTNPWTATLARAA